MMIKQRLLPTILGLSVGTLLPVASLAASDSAEPALEEIIVTAQKRAQSISDVPLTVQAFTGENLENKGISGVEGLLDQVPGGSITMGGLPNNPTVQIRGVGGALRGDPTVATYVDEHAFFLPSAPDSAPVNVFDLDRVEVLRGPQGTLYGFGAMGGTIKYLTKDPDASAGFKGKVRGWSSEIKDGGNSSGGDLAMNIPIIEDVLAGRISISYEDEGGYIGDFFGNRDVNNTRFVNARGKLKYTPNERLSTELSIWHNEIDNEYFNLLLSIDPALSIFGPGTFTRTEFDIYGFSVAYDLDFATLETSISYMDREVDAEFPVFAQTTVSDLTALVTETRLVSNGEGSLHWIVGGMYSDTEGEGIAITGTSSTDGEDTTEAFAFFGEISYDLMDGKLTPLFGLRYFEDKRGREFLNTTILPSGPVVTQLSLGETWETVNPRFNLTYRPGDDSLIYLNIAKGTRSGVFPSPTEQSRLLTFFGVPPVFEVDPDELWSYEIGGKWSLLGGNLQLDLAAYYMDWEDLHGQITTGAADGILLNTGDAEIYGFEYSISYNTPIEGLFVQLVGMTNSSEISDQNDEVVAFVEARRGEGGTNLTDGSRISGTPPFTYTLSLNYNTAFVADTNLNLYLGWSHRAPQVDVDTTRQTDDIDNVTFRATTTWDNLDITLFANNLLDEDGEASSLNGGFFVSRVAPREIGLEFVYHWGE